VMPNKPLSILNMILLCGLFAQRRTKHLPLMKLYRPRPNVYFATRFIVGNRELWNEIVIHILYIGNN
jgi:hypothetical protein